MNGGAVIDEDPHVGVAAAVEAGQNFGEAALGVLKGPGTGLRK